MNCGCISTPPHKEKERKKKKEMVYNITNTFHLPALGMSSNQVEREERLQLETKMKRQNFKRKKRGKELLLSIPWAVSKR